MLLTGTPGREARPALQSAFATACPTAPGVSGDSLLGRWLLAEPTNQVFGGAEDPWLCGAAHASLLLEASAALLACAALALLTFRTDVTAEDARPLLIFWAAVGASGFLLPASGARATWLPEQTAAAAAALQAAVAASALGVYLALRFCRGHSRSVVVLRPRPRPGAGGEGQAQDEIYVPASSGAWMRPMLGEMSGPASEQLLTDQLQAAFEQKASDIRRARNHERTEAGPGGLHRAPLRFVQPATRGGGGGRR
mmetsp:Transcript_59525/g.192568  ORF Transcript_59525/g.192568 Transcript_59525/m.192568 type:complete len:254 (-) Transcript_59525:417-1178(-)